MELVADRFVMRGGGSIARDLATGETVRLVLSSAGGPSEHLRWTLRCEWLARLRHPCIALLVDFGPVGETGRFEAWQCGDRVATVNSHPAGLRANAFLRACGRTTGAPEAVDVVRAGDRVVLLPSSPVGYPADVEAAELPLDSHGVSLVDRSGVRAIADALTHAGGVRPQVVGLAGRPGAGLSTALLRLARTARLHGFVPVRPELLGDKAIGDTVRGRSLFLVTMSGTHADWPRSLLEWTLRSNRPHFVLALTRAPSHERCVIALESLSTATLCSAVLPVPTSSHQMAVERAASRARGLPGRFVSLLWHREQTNYRRIRRLRSIAAERHSAYFIGGAAGGQPLVWPRAVDTSGVEHRLASAVQELQAGRHVAGARNARSAIAALVRRAAWDTAACGLIALARCQLKRGQAAAARSTLHEAEIVAGKADNQRPLLDIVLTEGETWIALVRLDDAERAFSAAIAAATALGDEERVAEATLGLTRALFWRGRFTEAGEWLAKHRAAKASGGVRLRMAAVEALAAVGAGDLARGIELATRTFEAAARSGDAATLVECGKAAAIAHLAVGDKAAVERDTQTVLRACRANHDPIGALETRLIVAESLRRFGSTSRASLLIRRTRRLSVQLPPILQARASLLGDLSAPGSAPAAILRTHVAKSGLGALRLFAAVAQTPDRVEAGLVDDMLEILRSCQTADDDRAGLDLVCERLRGRLQAAAVAILVPEDDTRVLLAGDRPRDDRMAHRIIDARQTIAPHQWDDSVEGGTPVLYGGEVLGALTARWTIAAPPDATRVAAVLTIAAAAIGPMVAALLARRRAIEVSTRDELIGVSMSIEQVRRAVERAARAPFHVLIEGESGSGKELVARALHRRSPRRERTFCTLNCAALPDDLVEAELFGHARGAFTGATVERIGVFEEAHTGTLFLDEIGELSPRAQAKVLRTLQEGEVRRIGENVSRRVDVRVIAATNRNLRNEVAAGRFRLDLLYRLDVVRISIPPLRDRREDVPILAEHFWRDATARVGSRATLTAATLGALSRHDWPGNVRELQNVLASLAVRSPRRGAVLPEALPAPLTVAVDRPSSRLADARTLFEEQFVRSALVRTGGHRARAARELGVSRQGLTKLMRRLRIATSSG